jgi:hypothetical protein
MLALHHRRRAVAAAAALVFSAAGALAEDDPKSPHLWEPRTKSATVFKDGYGFFMREGDVTLRDGWAVSGALPPASYGTLAFYSLNEKQLVDLASSGPGHIVEFNDVDAPKDLPKKRAILDGYIDMKLSLTWKRDKEERMTSGRLVSIDESFALVDEGGQTIAVPLADINKMQLFELPLRLHVSEGDKDATGKAPLGMAYLREGITWIPEYTLNILDDANAELTLKGVLINHAEDLLHADVNFVVGTPNFAHRAKLGPLVAGQVLRMIGGRVDGMVMSQIANSFTANMAPDGRMDTISERRVEDRSGDAIRDAMGNLPTISAEAATDFSVYRKEDLTIRTGEKAVVTLFKKKIEYQHLYEWNHPEPIRHSFVLKNASDSPWTTGSMMALTATQPLAEDLFKYVPAGGSGTFPISEALNISKKISEVEVDRKLKEYSTSDRNSFDLVRLGGEIVLRNFDKSDVHLVIDYPVPGKPIEASNAGAVETGTDNLALTERAGRIKWDLNMKPGETVTLTYAYERYVRTN